MPLRVSTGDRDAVLRQIRWSAAVQTLVNCHCKLEENPVGNVVVRQINETIFQIVIQAPNLACILLLGRFFIKER